MHGYAHFAEFGNPINSAVRPQKKTKCQTHQCYPNSHSVCIWVRIKNENYFTIQLIFATIMGLIALFGTIYEPHCIILTNFYLYL